MIIDLHAPFILLAALAGLLFGSFFNVCIYRLPRDLSIVAPRSFCPECGQSIGWYDNIPLLSFALLRGRCRHCAQSIGWRYPLVEIATALLFGAIAFRYGCSLAALKWLLFESLLVVLFFTDLEERLLPDVLTLGGALIGLAFAFFVPVRGTFVDVLLSSSSVLVRSVVNALFGSFVFALPVWLFAKLYEKIRQPDAMGLGDIKLLAMLGIFLGFDREVLALMIATIAGAVLGIAYVLVTRTNWRTASLPFGTFLCAGSVLLPLLFRM